MIWINQIPVEFTTFPNGESKMEIDSIGLSLVDYQNQVAFKYESDADLLRLLFVKKSLDERNLRSVLVIYYMPYSRMDRSENGSAFTLKYVAEMINAMNFETVTILEPHSDVTSALINRCHVIYPTRRLLQDAIRKETFNQEKDYLFFPDAGAQKRYNIPGFKHLVGYKHRNFETGKIESFQVVGDVPSEPFKVIIMDDLSSYGGTFIASAEQLRKIGATHITLVVAHAEETILKGQIFKTDLIDVVYTTDSIIDSERAHQRLHIAKVTGKMKNLL